MICFHVYPFFLWQDFIQESLWVITSDDIQGSVLQYDIVSGVEI